MMMQNETLARGAVVEVRTGDGDDPGAFVGTVVFVNEHVARIRPASADVRAFLGGDGYFNLGSAHWPSCITIRG